MSSLPEPRPALIVAVPCPPPAVCSLRPKAAAASSTSSSTGESGPKQNRGVRSVRLPSAMRAASMTISWSGIV